MTPAERETLRALVASWRTYAASQGRTVGEYGRGARDSAAECAAELEKTIHLCPQPEQGVQS